MQSCVNFSKDGDQWTYKGVIYARILEFRDSKSDRENVSDRKRKLEPTQINFSALRISQSIKVVAVVLGSTAIKKTSEHSNQVSGFVYLIFVFSGVGISRNSWRPAKWFADIQGRQQNNVFCFSQTPRTHGFSREPRRPTHARIPSLSSLALPFSTRSTRVPGSENHRKNTDCQ